MTTSTGSAARRVVALECSMARRRRLDDRLRKTLDAQRAELAGREAVRDGKAQQLEREAEVERFYRHRIDAMTAGAEPFLPDELNACRLYLDVVAERLRALEAALAQADALVRECLDAIERTRREIASNRVRIDLCSERVGAIRRRCEQDAADASDEEAGEAALARRPRTRGIPA